ncbi:MAG: LysR family transcriptional regulator [Thermoproteales archaeon]|nr:LysR family transcriptional regulator [Thermoproteales archaeon]RLE66965.1 MAG: hypothetical protein DRJ47_01325 [Thermoprotei archaeon]
MNRLGELKERIELFFEVNGKTLLDSRTAFLLKCIEEEGSILKASRQIGIPYSRAWESIARIERILGSKILVVKRGGKSGGGAQLTKLGKELLRLYLNRLRQLGLEEKTNMVGLVKPPELIFAGSHDIIVEHLIRLLKNRGVRDVDFSWIGSANGLATLMLEEADVAGIHLYDPSTGTYNTPFLEKYYLKNRVILLRGYARELGLIYRPGLNIKGLEDLFTGKYTFINRNQGSGTRIIFDYLLSKTAASKGFSLKEAIKRIPGYNNEVSTHHEVGEAISTGEADVGFGLKLIAVSRGLNFIPMITEEYDFAVLYGKMEKHGVKVFIKALKDIELRKLVEKMPGYKLLGEIGEVKYRPSI